MEQIIKPVVIIGYSGHAYVALDIFGLMGRLVPAYCDQEPKSSNPYKLTYLGNEKESVEKLKDFDFFVAIGDNTIRRKVQLFLAAHAKAVSAIHPRSVIASSAVLGEGSFVAAGTVVNPYATIGSGVVCNTSSVIDHECSIGDFSFIAPGATLCGNVSIGYNTFIGANSVIRQGIRIGNNVMVGAGSVVTHDLADNARVMGNPAK